MRLHSLSAAQTVKSGFGSKENGRRPDSLPGRLLRVMLSAHAFPCRANGTQGASPQASRSVRRRRGPAITGVGAPPCLFVQLQFQAAPGFAENAVLLRGIQRRVLKACRPVAPVRRQVIFKHPQDDPFHPQDLKSKAERQRQHLSSVPPAALSIVHDHEAKAQRGFAFIGEAQDQMPHGA